VRGGGGGEWFSFTSAVRDGVCRQTARAGVPRPPAGTTAPSLTPPPVLSGTADEVDARTRGLCAHAAARAGLTLNDEQFAQLLEGAPYALEMLRRLRRDHGYADEPANIFSLPTSL
jgi:hypothetical protein